MDEFLKSHPMVSWMLAGVAFLVAFVLILKIIEIAVDLRRRLPRGSRSRQLRLGFVETFELDGERQLLLVRRDNVEHLLMIGGPNDVLVELGIVRVEPREARAHRGAEPAAPALSSTSAPVMAPSHEPVAGPEEVVSPPLIAAIEAALAAPPAPPADESDLHDALKRAAELTPADEPAPDEEEKPAAREDQPPPVVTPPAAPAPTPAAPERFAPRFPLPPRLNPAPPPKPPGPLPPPRFPHPSAPSGVGPKGDEPPPRPRFVMPPIARRMPPPAPPAAPPPVIEAEERPAAEPAPAVTPPPVEAAPPPPPAPPPPVEAAPPPAPPAAREKNFDPDFEPLEIAGRGNGQTAWPAAEQIMPAL